MKLEDLWLAEQPRLRVLAYRIVGSWHDAEDVIGLVGLAVARQGEVRDPRAWLTRVAVNAAIDISRARQRQREDYVGPWLPEPVADEYLLDDVVANRELLSLGLLRVLQLCSPRERAIYILREGFVLPYAHIARIVDAPPATCRQAFRRVGERIRSVSDGRKQWDRGGSESDLLVALFEAVSAGDVNAAARLLAPECVLWTDGGGVTKSALRPILGAVNSARFLVGVTQKAGELSPVRIAVNGGEAFWFDTPVGPRVIVAEWGAGGVVGLQVQGNPSKLQACGPGRATPRAR